MAGPFSLVTALKTLLDSESLIIHVHEESLSETVASLARAMHSLVGLSLTWLFK